MRSTQRIPSSVPAQRRAHCTPRAGALRALGAAFAAAATLGLAACAAPVTGFQAGATEADVVARAGRPHAVHTLPGGGKRLEYVTGHLQQYKYMVDVDAGGRVLSVAQVMSWEHFKRLEPGVDTQETVLRALGHPFYIRTYATAEAPVWHYPYKEGGAFDYELGVYFDSKGVLTRIESGPDPRSLRDGDSRNQ